MSEKQAKSVWSDLWLKEDYWAIWLGFFLLIVGSVLFLPNPPEGMEINIQEANTTMDREAARAPFKTLAYYEAQDNKAGLRARNSEIGHKLAAFFKEPQSWTNNPINAFYQGQSLVESHNAAALPNYETAKMTATMALHDARTAEAAAEAAGFQDQTLNDTAEAKIDA